MHLRRVPLALLAAPFVVLPLACSDDSDDESSVDPTACNTSLSVAGVDGAEGQFGAESVLAAGGPGVDEETLEIVVSGLELAGGTIPAEAPEVPEDANYLLLTLTAPEGGFADGQTFTDGDEEADGELTAVFRRGADETAMGSLVVTIGEITDPLVCGAIAAEGAGVDGEFKAERVGAAQPDDTTTTAP